MTADVLNERRRTVAVVPLSTSPVAAPPIRIAVHCGGRSAVAVTDQIRALAKERLVRRAGKLADEEMRAVEQGLQAVLELD